ncbi:MAG: sigma-70 family RNA polymerase sigma factor [Synergistaceae bacterium]|jgi:RNA polymerase sigma factor (sigma-70 family)|nr:sigma-70 family RNA polymerase sigma factor [Synergistaceae bacterium]
MPSVRQEARKLARRDAFVVDDLVQEGAMAVMSALGSYNPSRGSADSYMRACARNRMISYLRRNGHESPMEEGVLEAGAAAPELAGESPADERLGAIEMRELMCALMKRLSPFEMDVFAAYLEGGGISGIASAMKCGRKKADNAIQRVRNKARALLRDK